MPRTMTDLMLSGGTVEEWRDALARNSKMRALIRQRSARRARAERPKTRSRAKPGKCVATRGRGAFRCKCFD